MIYFDLDSEAWAAQFNQFKQQTEQLNKSWLDVNVLNLFNFVNQIPNITSRFSCSGHPDVKDNGSGYFTLVARDNDSQSKLLNLLQRIEFDPLLDWNSKPIIEVGYLILGEVNFEHTKYKTITIQTKKFKSNARMSSFWKLYTDLFIKHAEKEFDY